MSNDDFGQGVNIAELLDAPNAEVLAKNIVNGVLARSILVYASVAERSATMTGAAAPVEGMHTYLKDTKRLYQYHGSVWRQVSSLTQQGSASLSWTNANSATLNVTFPFAFSATPNVFTNINSGNGAVARWASRAYNISTTGFTIFLTAPDPAILSSGTNIPVQWFASLN
ncbi:H-type lectin domain-containing protein [Streptomyces sp. NPDC052069]|uniref:H-type lectin domain-containing protein n=1 Tax=Streptomyces sp. NPDC052069 TaxID=3154650 RepID=UPI00341CA197